MLKKWESFLWRLGYLRNDSLSGHTPEEALKAYKALCFWIALETALLLTWWTYNLMAEIPKCITYQG